MPSRRVSPCRAAPPGDYLLEENLAAGPGGTAGVLSGLSQHPEGPVRQTIGSFPLMGESEALAALDAAVRAMTMAGALADHAVAGRIEHLQEFAWRMKERRDEVVKLLMWEIGKSLADSARSSTGPWSISRLPSTPSRT